MRGILTLAVVSTCHLAAHARAEELQNLIVQRGHAGEITALSLSADGALLASASRDKTVKLWDTVSGLLVDTFTGAGSATTWMQIDDTTLVTRREDGLLWNYDLETRTPTRIGGTRAEPSQLALVPDGSFILIAQRGTPVQWRTTNGTQSRNLSSDTAEREIADIAIHPDGSRFAIACAGHCVEIRDVKTGNLIQGLGDDPPASTSVTWDRHGKRLAAAYENGGARVWRADGTLVHVLKLRARADL